MMLWILIKKELHRVFSDRRLVFSAFILPALSLYILYSLMGNMVGDLIDDTVEHDGLVAVFNGPESFKSFMAESGQTYGVTVLWDEGSLESMKEGLKYGGVDLILVFGEEFTKRVADYRVVGDQAHISTFYNPSEDYSSAVRYRVVKDLLVAYEEILLTERFGDPVFASAFAVDEENLNNEVMDEAKATGTGLSMVLPMLIAILLFAGAMGIGIDTIAGEKERGTMATLLMTPVSREVIALGKLIGLAIIAIISAMTSFIAIIASLPSSGKIMAGGDVAISSLQFSPLMYVQLLVTMLTLVGIYVGLICIASVRAHSVKEAGTYVSPIYMVVMFAAFSTMFSTGEPAAYRFAIPIMGNILCIRQLFTFELGMAEFLVTTGVSIGVTAVLIAIITRSFKDERVMM